MVKDKLILVGSIVGLSVFLTACHDDVVNGEPQIEVPKVVALDESTFSTEVSVKANIIWDVSVPNTKSWIKVKQKYDGFDILAEPNATGHKRSLSVKISGKGINSVVEVEQDPVDVEVLIIGNSSETWLNYYQNEYEFFIYSKTPWKLASSANWATLDKTSGEAGSTKIKLSFDSNIKKEKRETTLVLTSKNGESRQSVIQRGKKSFDDATHHFYVHQATFPVLYSGMHMLSHDKKGWLIDTRNTLSTSDLPSNIEYLELSDFQNVIADMVKKIDAEDPDATFAYYAEDMRMFYAISIFTRAGIDTSRVKLNIFPDGVGAYVAMFNTPYGKEGVGGAKYKENQDKLKKIYSDRIKNPTVGLHDARNTDNYQMDMDFPHIMAGYSNIRFFIQYEDYLLTEDPYVKEQIKKNNYEIKTPKAMLDDLSIDKQNEFYKLAGFDKKVYEDQFNASPKPNLIILGTNTNGNATVQPARQAAYVQAVMDEYSGDYDVFYKAHPADKAYEDYEKKFPGLKLIMPAKMPFDVFTWALDDQISAIGGFNSTVFLSVPLDKAKFMFAKDAQDLGPLFYDLFKDKKDIYWIDK